MSRRKLGSLGSVDIGADVTADQLEFGLAMLARGKQLGRLVGPGDRAADAREVLAVARSLGYRRKPANTSRRGRRGSESRAGSKPPAARKRPGATS